jgi:hypothetical protein
MEYRLRLIIIGVAFFLSFAGGVGSGFLYESNSLSGRS